MRDISEIQDRESLRYVIRHELKDLGIKLPKSKEKKNPGGRQLAEKSGSSIFGRSLNDVTTVITNEEYGQTVPKFVVDCVAFLENHLQVEGLFRKPGSQARQRELQRHLQIGEPIPADAHLPDVAGLFKQFFRQLPDTLLTNRLLDTYIKCQQIGNEQDREYATLLLTDTMPQIHIHTLAYVMRFLKTVSLNAEHNKMDSANLAVVLAPNFLHKSSTDHSDKGMTATDRLLKLQTGVVQLLIEQADKIGTVPESIVEKVYNVSNKGGDITDRLTSEDELDKSIDLDAKWRRQGRRKRGKSASIHGLVSGIGNRVKSRKNSSNEYLSKTPGREDIFSPSTEVPVGAQTPRILRSSKRKASDDTPTFSAAKRKAMLQRMTVDPRYSKPGLSLHRTAAVSREECDSPITPLRPPQPSLGEVDAVTQQGETLNFQTPSIKFADESFTSFSATPAHECPTNVHLSLSYTTPGRKKTKKLNPLSSKKKRRSFNLGNATPPTQHTPRGMYQSIKRKFGHKSSHSQSLRYDNSPEKGIGYRLANEPYPDGLDTLKFYDSDLEQATQLRRTPAFRQKHRKTPSSPALLVTKPVFTKCEIPIDNSPCNVSLLNEAISNVSLMNNSSPRVVVVDLKLDPQAQNCVEQSEEVTSMSEMPTGKSLRKPPSKPKRSGDLTPVQSPLLTPKGKSGKKVPLKPRRSQQNLTPVKSLVDLEMDDKDAEETSGSKLTHVVSQTSLDSVQLPDMVPSISHQSISSILSQVSVSSVKSTFSIEHSEEPTVVYDDVPALPKVSHANPLKDRSVKKPADIVSMPKDINKPENNNSSIASRKAVSMESVDLAPDETDGNSDMQQRRLTKSISVDSGKGASIDDLVELGVLVHKKPGGFSSEAETNSSSAIKTRKKLQQMSCLTPGSGSPLVKSLSASDVNSCSHSGNPYASTPCRLTRSQTISVPEEEDGNDTFNTSIVQANIQLFNAMSHPNLSSALAFPANTFLKKLSKGDSSLSRSASTANSRSSRRRSLSDDGNYKRKPKLESLPPISMVKSTSIDSGLLQQVEKHDRLPKITEKSLDITMSATPMRTLRAVHESHNLNDSYEAAILKPNKTRRHSSLKVNMRDISTPRSLRKVLGDHNVTLSPSELEKVAKDVPPIEYHPHRSEPLTPIKLAKSTKMRTQGRKNVTVKYSPSGKLSPVKPVKRLQSPKGGLHFSNHHHYDYSKGPSNQGTPSQPSRKSSRRRYPSSPLNPLTRASPKTYPRSPVNPLALQPHLAGASSVPVNDVEDDMEWKV